ncbi:hypothetical protein DFA_04163 [Cavenderia fasciculata]|uniref:Uncharacterized protein n=1 Tax=Cavenderia fasciculata TaxID=261658 RepID=F4Q1G6_CACFS|nr:uncharacterized protein DFA_04163 [Cavenderia fasciculata]EGG18667.1 hypothetical protein DFA_04163 [Cavenderia fasciculata]|eukprot:XP_004366571.1 hypothetical protein DFA_04163 [Cavenderia fasciculata]
MDSLYGPDDMDGPCQGGHLEIVEFLHKYGNLKCSWEALIGNVRYDTCKYMDLTANIKCKSKRPFTSCQFLNRNRTEECTSRAINYASKNVDIAANSSTLLATIPFVENTLFEFVFDAVNGVIYRWSLR